jgi:membrane protein implicated in regulation of membrane protease activity
MIVLAHAAHWAVQLLYLAPLVVLVWMLVAARLRERRERETAERSSD